MKHLLIILSFLLLSSPVIGQSGKPLGVIFPPTIMGDVSDSRQQILLNTLDDEISQYFDVSPRTNVSSGELPLVEDVFQLQIVEEDGDTQLTLRWTNGDNRRTKTILCGGCKTFELNEKLVGLTGKLIGQRVGSVGVNKPLVKVKKKPVVKEKVYVSAIDPDTGFRLNLSEMKQWEREECMEVAKLLPADDRLKLLRGCGLID